MENADDATLQEVKNILYAAHKGLNNAQRKLIFTMGDNDPFFISIQQLDSKIQELMNGDILYHDNGKTFYGLAVFLLTLFIFIYTFM